MRSRSIINKNRMQEETPPYFKPLIVLKGLEIKFPSFSLIYSPSYIEPRILITFPDTWSEFKICQTTFLCTESYAFWMSRNAITLLILFWIHHSYIVFRLNIYNWHDLPCIKPYYSGWCPPSYVIYLRTTSIHHASTIFKVD